MDSFDESLTDSLTFDSSFADALLFLTCTGASIGEEACTGDFSKGDSEGTANGSLYKLVFELSDSPDMLFIVLYFIFFLNASFGKEKKLESYNYK